MEPKTVKKSLYERYERESSSLAVFSSQSLFLAADVNMKAVEHFREVMDAWQSLHKKFLQRLDKLSAIQASEYEECLQVLLRLRKSMLSVFLQRTKVLDTNPRGKEMLRTCLREFVLAHDAMFQTALKFEREFLKENLVQSNKTHKVIRAYSKSSRLGITNLGS